MADFPENTNGASIWLAVMITCMTAAQVVFKLAGIHAATDTDIPRAIVANPWLWLGLLCAAAAAASWLFALRKLSLAQAYPWTAAIYILTPLASALLFGDVLDERFLLGMALITAGVFLTAGGVETS